MQSLESGTINGVDVAAVQKLAAEITEDPAQGMAGFRATTAWKGGLASTTRIDGWTLGGQEIPHSFTFEIDEPRELAGGDSAPNPQEYLMAALNGCVLNTYVAICALHGIKLETLELRSEGVLDLRGFLGIDKDVNPGYDEVQYTIRVKGDATPEEFQKVNELVQRTSPNFANFARPIQLTPELVVE